MRPDTRQPAGPPAAGNDDQILAGDNPVVSFSRYRARKRLRRTNVLVVVDDREGYMRIRNFLGESRDTRFVCTYCRDFDTSVEAIRSKKFDIALVDHRIGARSGLDLIRDAGGPLAPTLAGDPRLRPAPDSAPGAAGRHRAARPGGESPRREPHRLARTR